MLCADKQVEGAVAITWSWQSARVPLLAGTLYFTLSTATIYLSSNNSDIATFWPANALLVAVLLLRTPAEWSSILAVGFFGNVLANLCVRGAIEGPILFGAANMVEVIIAGWGIRRGMAAGQLQKPSVVWRFAFWAGLIAPGTSAFLAGGIATLVFEGPFGRSFLTWYVADALGLLTCLPFFYGVFSGEFVRCFREKRWIERLEAAALIGLTGLVTAIVFSVHRLPLLFLITLPMLLVTFRAGWSGSKIAVLVIAVIGGTATMHHVGPIMLASPDPAMQVVFFQFFLAAMLLVSMPVAATVTARKDLIQKLHESERSLRLIATQSPTLVLQFAPSGVCDRAFGAADVLFGRRAESFLGAPVGQLSPGDADLLQSAHEQVLARPGGMRSIEFQLRENGRWLEMTFCALRAEDGECVGTLASIHDVTVSKQHAAMLARAAETDSLTGLFNRAGFMTRLDDAIAQAPSQPLSLAMIDVDRFKQINDNSGHHGGDAVLREIARRLADIVGMQGTVGRLGGDEFVVLLPVEEARARAICSRMVASVREAPILPTSEEAVHATISCGLFRHRAGMSADMLLHDADKALYEAKRGGRNQLSAVAAGMSAARPSLHYRQAPAEKRRAAFSA